ncbi:MAG: hypothetical protein JWQ74_1187 [Marmoricola sp.]|nr:hypothetical protein [Marmoricola sp.]
MAAVDNPASRTRARARRQLARTNRRLRHGRPKLSIVVLAAGGDPGRVRATLESVCNQPSPELEIVVVGDHDALGFARSWAGADTRTRFLAAATPGAARRRGVHRSRGATVLVASPGDSYPRGALADLIGGLDAEETLYLPSDADVGVGVLGPTDLARTPAAALLPYLGRLLVPRARALAALTAAAVDDLDGLEPALALLDDGFVVGPWSAYRNVRDSSLSRFVTRPDPFPGLADRVARDRATLDLLADRPAVRSVRAAGALADLRQFLDPVELAADEDWALLAEHAAGLAALAGDDLILIDVASRVLALLAAEGERSALAELAASLERSDDFPTSVSGGVVRADLGVPEGLLDQDAYTVSEGESALLVHARRLVVDGPVVRIEVFAGVCHVDQAGNDTIGAELLTGAGSRPVRLRTGNDPAVTRWMAEPEHEHDAGLVQLELDAGYLEPGTHEIGLTWRGSGLERRALLTGLVEDGSAGRPLVPVSSVAGRPADRYVGLRLRHGRVVLVVSEIDPGAPGAPDPTLTRVEVDGDVLRLTLDRVVDTVRLTGQGTGQAATAGTAGFWTVPLVADPWGLGTAPLPSGTYRLALTSGGSKVPVRASAPVLDLLPVTWRTGQHLVELVRSGRSGVRVRLAPLLADDERGPRAQRRLQREYAVSDRPLDDRLVSFQSFTGQWANDNPRAIYDELVRHRPDLDLVWMVADSSAAVPPGSRPVLFRSREYYDVMARAAYLVINVEVERSFARRPGQQILQTFHGYPSKAMGRGIWEPRRVPPRRIQHHLDSSSGVWNNLLTPDPQVDRFYRRDYDFEGRILPVGYPRNDVLVGPELAALRAATRQRLGIADHQQAVLYAPTWRDDQLTRYRTAEVVQHLDVAQAAAALGENHVLLLRGHRFLAPPGAAGARTIDVTRHPDVSHLIAAADVAVLDYSSLRFDFALTGKPMVFLVPDLDTYGSRTRGFLWDFRETAPGPLVATTAQVVGHVRDVEGLRTRYADELAAFNERYNGMHDGHAAQRAVAEFFGPLLGT